MDRNMETVGQIFCTSPHPFYHHQQPIFAADQSSFYYQFSDRPQENWWKSDESEEEESSSMNDEDEDVLERFMREIDEKGHEMIKKLVSKVENKVPFEQAFRETWHHFRGKPAASHMMEKIARKMGREREGGFVMRERGLDLQGDLKNERFKVKTMNIIGSGVVKEEGRRS